MRSFPCATAGSRGCSTSDARRCLRGSSPSFRGPNGEGFCASQSRSAFRTRATVNTGVRQRSICGRWARSRRRSHGARSSSMYLHTNRYTTRSAGLWPRSPRAETRNGSSAGSETDVGGNRPRGGACPRRPCGTANGSVRGVVLTCVAALGARSSDSVTGSLIDAGRQSPGVISGAVQQSLSWRGLTCLPRAARESARAISSQPAAHHPDGPDRSHPEAYLLRSTPRGGSKRRKQPIRCARPTRWDQKGPARASRPSRHRECSPSAGTVSMRGWKVRPRGEKVKRGWGRLAQRSSDDEFSSLWPSELSPSLPSIGFLMTRFWTIGAGALVGPGGDIGPRAWILRAGAPATTAPPLGGRWSRIKDPHLWQTVAVTELRVPQVGHGFEPILRISSSSRSQSSKVRKVGCLRHHSWNSVSLRLRPSCREASCLKRAMTSSYWRRIFSL